MIRAESLCVAYGGQRVLRDCTLELEAGERVALMGPSGCGKTTLLQVLAGLLPPDSGRFAVKGRVSYVFQEPALFPWLTAAQNINVVLSDRPETLSRALSLLDALELADCRDKYPAQLSGGQKQRVSIARALANKPALLFADEPTGNLDGQAGREVLSLLRQVGEELGVTLVLVTHDLHVAEQAGRILRLEDGKITGDSGEGSL